MIFINDVRYIKIWAVEKKEKHIKLQCSTGDKKQDGTYENSGWYINLVGKAFEQGLNLKVNDTFTIVKGKISNVYNKDKKVSYLNVVAFEIEAPDSEEAFEDNMSGFQAMEEDDDIPF